MLLKNFLFGIFFLSGYVFARGGNKCILCPSCMVCDPLVGCVYDNFSKCTVNKVKGYCTNGSCNTTIGVLSITKPAVCKTYKFTNVTVNGVDTLKRTTVDDINGLSCTTPGALLESVCIKGTCTPYTLAIDKLGKPTGCNGMPDGFMCDTNAVLTDGEVCMNQKCVMPENPQLLCRL